MKSILRRDYSALRTIYFNINLHKFAHIGKAKVNLHGMPSLVLIYNKKKELCLTAKLSNSKRWKVSFMEILNEITKLKHLNCKNQNFRLYFRCKISTTELHR